MEPSESAAEAVLLEALQRCGHIGAEIEWRLGEKTPTGFVPGVTKDVFARAIAALETLTGTPGESLETIENVTEDGIKRIEINGPTPSVSWVHKNKIVHLDLPTYRISFAQETTLETPPTPVPAFRHTRRKRRRSFAYKFWRIDLTMVLTDLDAEDYVYEIELEVQPLASVFVYEMSYICASAIRLIKKITSM